MILMGKAGDVIQSMGIRTELCTMNLRQLMIREYYSNHKAVIELHLPQSEIKTAVSEAIDWFNEHNMA